MAYRAAVVGGSGYTGAELLRLLAGPPRDRGRARHRRHATPARVVGDLYPSLGPRTRDLRLRAVRRRRPRRRSTSCSPRCRTARRSCWFPSCSNASAHVVDLGADFRLPADAVPPLVRRAARRARAARPVRLRPGRALPRRARDATTTSRARLLSDRGEPRARAAASPSDSSSRAASSPTRCRACPARDAASRRRASSPRRTRTCRRTAC